MRRYAGRLLLAIVAAALSLAAVPRHKKGRIPPALGEILTRMDEASKNLKTVSANLEYTKVTVVVNDRSTEYGKLYFRNAKSPEILLEFDRPDPKTILFKKNKAEMYLPKINQIQEYDLSHHSEIVQQFLLLGFGTESNALRKAYDVKLVGEEDVNGDTTAVLELTPRKASVAAQIAKVSLWINEESWLPAEQKFFEPGGDYLETKYSSVVTGRDLPPSVFELPAAKGAKRVKMG
jgi:outer membrane lipoprotein-sorting protein